MLASERVGYTLRTGTGVLWSLGVHGTPSGVMQSATCLLIKVNPAVACVLGVSVCAQHSTP